MKTLITFLLQFAVLGFLCRLAICMVVPKSIRRMTMKLCKVSFSTMKSVVVAIHNDFVDDEDDSELDDNKVIEITKKAKAK